MENVPDDDRGIVEQEQRTVAVIAGEDRQATHDVLELLTRCLSPGDTVVVAGTGGPPAAGAWRIGQGARRVELAQAPAWAPVVVVVDWRAVPVGPWLPPLQRALSDRSVGAAAPRTNLSAGDELLVGVPYRPEESGVHRAFVHARADDPTLTDVSFLAGPCVAVRRRDFEAVGGPQLLAGPAPVTELARRIAGRGHRLVVAEGAFLHVAGGPAPRAAFGGGGGAPLVTACLIVKDEQESLPRCLRSLEWFCDEVVVYDTGSGDDTRAVARSAGATVVEGYWDGDFARARNAALAHCHGQWILWVDADEELVCDDRFAARRRLAELPASAEALIVLIDNVRGTLASTSLAHPACRLFRRAYGHWTGRIHEQVQARAGSPALRTLLSQDVRITHWGYLRSVVERRAKGERNVRAAFADLAGVSSLPWAARLVSLARSYGLRGQPEEAVDLGRAALDAATDPHTRRLAVKTLLDSLRALGDPQTTLSAVAALRDALAGAPADGDAAGADDAGTRGSAAAALAEGRAYLALGRPDRALASFDQVPAGLDEHGIEVGAHGMAADKAAALAQLGRFGEAADLLLAGIRATGGMDAPVSVLLDCLERAGRSAHELAAAVPPERQMAFVGQLVNADPGPADRALEAWHESAPSLAVLATAAKVATCLPLPRRIVWSARLREHGLPRPCPLVATVADVARPVSERLLAAAITVQLWGDPRGRQAVTALVAMLLPSERAAVAPQVVTIAPAVAPIVGAVTPTPRPGAWRRAAQGGGGSRVLVVDRQPAGLRTMALAVSLRSLGHDVTVSWPASVPAVERRLAAEGIVVRVWALQDPGWQRAGSTDVALAAAAGRFDAVVLTAPVLAMAPAVRAILPHAALVVDLDEAPQAPAAASDADLFLTSRTLSLRPQPPQREAAGAVVSFPASAEALFGPAPPTPWDLRQGVVVVGDFALCSESDWRRWQRVLAPQLQRHLDGQPIVVIGHDPEGAVTRSLPGALWLGAPADPVSWLRAARVALVSTSAGLRHWRALAELAGTPVLWVPAPETADDIAQQQIAALAGRAAALVRAPSAPLFEHGRPAAEGPAHGGAPFTPAADPLAQVRADRPAPARPAPATPGRRVAWTGTSAVKDRLRAEQGPNAPGGSAGASLLEIRSGDRPDLSPRRARRTVVEMRWGYATLPVEWVGPLRDVADQVWVSGAGPAQVLTDAGVPPHIVHTVPPGVDIVRFAPERAPYVLRTTRSVRLLCVGACDEASGVDALLEAYFMAFTDDDDVCLVVRPTGPADRRTYEADLRRAAAGAAGRPEVEVVGPDLAPGDVAGLYRACDLLVHPNRASGSPREILEAMACGRPVVTLDGGLAADLCDQHTGWLAACRPVHVAAPCELVVPSELVQLEPRRAALARVLREAVASADRRLCKGLAARDRAVTRYSLDTAVAAVSARIRELCETAHPGAAPAGTNGGQDPTHPVGRAEGGRTRVPLKSSPRPVDNHGDTPGRRR